MVGDGDEGHAVRLPLAGLRILAVEQYGAGPYGSTHLADMGAEVIKIEHRGSGGDMSRSVGPYFLGEHDSHFFQSLNRNKKSLTLDLKHPAGRAVLEKLVPTAKGLFGNMRGNQPEKLRLRYADLKHLNPAIVCAHLSAYGREGSRKGWPGYDYLVQAECGFLALTGEPDGPPARFGLSMVDFMTGMTTAFALLCGLHAARETGIGRDVDVSLYDVAMHQLSYPAAWYLSEGHMTTRMPRSAHPYIVPSQLYRTRDGWIFLMCQTQRFWEILCDRIGRPELTRDPAYRDQAARHANRDRLTAELDATLATRSTAEWFELMGGAVPCAPVCDLGQALDNPFYRERAGVQRLEHPDHDGLKVAASPIRMGAAVPARAAPKLGQDTDAILQELGYDQAAIDALREEGVI
jgi:crotonobetainyl-CoA:carnitine CoA-transferase CaiB-like acyl-CoA transferase